MAETAVNFLMENLKQLINCKTGLISQEKDQIESLYEELGLLRTFLKDREEKFYNHEELKNLEARIRELAYETKNTIDLFTVNPNPSPNPNSILEEEITIKKKKKDIGMTEKIRNVLDFMVLKKKAKKKDNGMAEKIGHVFDRSLNLDHVKQQIEAIKTDVMEICGKNIHDVGAIKVQTRSTGDSSTANSPTWEEETMVGFDEEATTIKEQLTGGPKQLEVLSIVGMPGLGKTTLAKKVYNDPYVRYYFYIRAWVNVSQDYRKRDLLIGLLSSVIERKDGIDRMSDEKLTEKLYKALKGRIYFIVMDDIWDNRAWVDVKSCFPNDSNGSRIMFTSRIADVALHGKSNSPPLSLRFLTHDESWDLLQQKVFRRETCPPQLIDIGKQIARKCQGLPLAIVVLAGVLANEEKRQDRWKQVGETINSYIAGDSQLCMETLALSYNHLPHHLKQCFLYFGAFREDFEIPVQKLIWLWVAERFIGKIDGKSLEDVAEEYLTDLIGRSLVLVSKRRSDGGIKACGIHDLLRDFCLKKAEEEYFLKHISDR